MKTTKQTRRHEERQRRRRTQAEELELATTERVDGREIQVCKWKQKRRRRGWRKQKTTQKQRDEPETCRDDSAVEMKRQMKLEQRVEKEWERK
jgi:hypothetical protein